MRLRFTKMQGAGNDFVLLDATRAPVDLDPAARRARPLDEWLEFIRGLIGAYVCPADETDADFPVESQRLDDRLDRVTDPPQEARLDQAEVRPG